MNRLSAWGGGFLLHSVFIDNIYYKKIKCEFKNLLLILFNQTILKNV